MTMAGRTVAATGATSGIGEKAVEALAAQGARIVFVARDKARAEATLARLGAIAPGLDHRYFLADLSSMAETRRVGTEIAATAPRIDALINNAGGIFARRRVTAEGLELTFALNHMSYFVLTAALLERLKSTPGARVVSTASRAHFGPPLDFADLQAERSYGSLRAYQRSKLANILFTRELARRLAGGGVTANCFHPGLVASRFGDGAGGWAGLAFATAKTLFGVSPEQGADTLVYLVASPELEGTSGEYFAQRGLATISAAARDAQAARRLWEISERLAASV